MLIQKLKLKDGEAAVLNAPKDVAVELQGVKLKTSLPAGAADRFDFILLFAKDSSSLVPAWKKVIPALKREGMLWVAYPKKSSGIESDLSGMTGSWSVYAGSDWQPVASISINETWTGVRFKYSPGLESERHGRAEETIKDADGTVVVDRANRVIQPPKDFAQLLAKHPEAKALFEKLSFTNRKEYVLWIVEAKKQETRENRLKLALEKIVSGKKNPAEK